MKKVLLMLLVVLLVSPAVFAGGQAEPKEGSAKVVSVFGAFVDEEARRFEEAIKPFEERTGIDVVYEGSSEFETLISVRVEGGNPPDIAGLPQPGLMKNFAAQGKLVPMWSSLEQAIDTNYAPVWKSLGSFEGTPYGVFHRVNAKSFVWYPKKAWDKAGYTVPTTWDEVFAIAEDIKAREPESFPFGYDSEDNLFITGSKQFNAPYTGYNTETGLGEVQFNNELSKDMVKYFKDKVDEGLMTTRTLNGGAYNSDTMKAANPKTYMYVGSTGGTRYAYVGADAAFAAGYRVGVAPLPGFTDEARFQIQQGPNINLFKSNDEQRMIAAWLFAKFMLEPERTAEFSIPSGYAPIRYSAYETTRWNNYVEGIKDDPATLAEAIAKLVKEAIEIFLENEDIFFTSAVFNQSSKTRSEVGALLVKILAYDAVSDADLDAYIDEQYQESFDFITN